ncbi:MAG: hypothetical protein KDD60_09140 [Bdellovibrionales bacterium]|nr:hypothetical protein [Bdellovibrionales bacterium]
MNFAKLIAHRGDMISYPENTLVAIEAAVANGFLNIEFDIQFSSDGQPIVFHDSDLSRVTQENGVVTRMPWSDLAKIPVSSSQSREASPYHSCIPTLDEVVSLLNLTPAITAFIEIKRHSLAVFGSAHVLARVSECLASANFSSVIISFDRQILELFRERLGARIGYVLPEFDENYREISLKLNPEFLFCNLEKLGNADEQLPERVQSRLWSGGWNWVIYDIRSRAIAEKFILNNIWVETGDSVGIKKL